MCFKICKGYQFLQAVLACYDEFEEGEIDELSSNSELDFDGTDCRWPSIPTVDVNTYCELFEDHDDQNKAIICKITIS